MTRGRVLLCGLALVVAACGTRAGPTGEHDTVPVASTDQAVLRAAGADTLPVPSTDPLALPAGEADSVSVPSTDQAVLPAAGADAALAGRAAEVACPVEATPRGSTPIERADAMLAGEIIVGAPLPPTELPIDLSWTEDPIGDVTWRHHLHTLRWLRDLVVAAEATGDPVYLLRLEEIVRDWIDDNPLGGESAEAAWRDHSTAWRAFMFACLRDDLGSPEWLDRALVEHAELLADDDFYVGVTNHGFNQDRGLFAAGCVLGRSDFIDVALARMTTLISAGVDHQGVTIEQAPEYQRYNRDIYSRAIAEVEACGHALPGVDETVEAMTGMLVHSTKPNGRYAMLGDTRDLGGVFPDEYMSAELSVSYEAGFAFGRQAWHDPDAAWYSVSYGPPKTIHGHEDHGSITWYQFGQDLLIDPGLYAYATPPWRSWFVGRTAHNVIVVDGVEIDGAAAAELVEYESTPAADRLVIEYLGIPGVTWIRTIEFDRASGDLAVVDELESDREHTYEQLWHLAEGAAVVDHGPGHAVIQIGSVNVDMQQSTPTDGVRLVQGSSDPIQGWVSYTFRQRSPAPVLIWETTGSSVRFVTELTASRGG